ncbi:PAS domain-containing sensor histidine kinase [Sphingomonas sp. BAUL-RG-20F-R05-02]|uniref:hybrid sensor histidine kinase/response regulator n=1 Tax=Sphingomonas sp. BAUL-RG-20F-R05-02 TaxID=2914830 RepID=UPI001F580C02|nr:PAS domain-containing sensor histidine kinase [Sphingomonas sp. BAUL-RG-20F-R05-02]
MANTDLPVGMPVRVRYLTRSVAMVEVSVDQNRQLKHLGGDRRFELLVNAIKDYAIYLLDRDGYIASWNAGAGRFKGYRADEIIGQHFSRFYTDEDRARGLPQRALEIARTTGTFEAEGWRVRKDGTQFWTSVVIDPVVDENGTLIGFAKVTRDITDKRAAERALLESEQRFRLLVHSVRDYAIYMLDPLGHVSNWNPGAEAIKGYTADEIVGQHFSRFYVEEDRQAGEPERALRVAREMGKYEVEAWRQRKDGSRFRAGVLIDPIFAESGELVGFAKVTRDLTERWQAQQETERAREAMAQAQKMEAVGRLTGGVAHDFNNLLTVIRSSADLLKMPGLTPGKREMYLNAISDTADRAAALTSQLLAFARRQPLKPEVFDVGQRIVAMLPMLETSVGSTVRVTIDAEQAGVVNADLNQFETAVLNLVINARDAMPAGGVLSVTSRLVGALPAVRGHGAATGRFVAVRVADTGSGIAPETLKQIFEPFFTTKALNKGTGLGLSQVHGFAKQSGGEIDVESQPGRGAAFTLYLPVAREDQIAAAAPARQMREQDLTTLRVLLVEDNEAVGQFARGLLEELGQIVTWAPNGESALDLLEAAADKFDLVFTDVIMPGINGLELAQTIAARWPDLEVVLTSGYSHVLAEESDHGFTLLRKPYSVEGLMNVLRLTGR